MADQIPHGQGAAQRASEIVDKAYQEAGTTPQEAAARLAEDNRKRNLDPETGINNFVQALEERKAKVGKIEL